jgi:hypothetical protein
VAAPGSDTLLFVKNGSSYTLQTINAIGRSLPTEVAAQRARDNAVRFTVRTLSTGHR